MLATSVAHSRSGSPLSPRLYVAQRYYSTGATLVNACIKASSASITSIEPFCRLMMATGSLVSRLRRPNSPYSSLTR